MPNSLKCKVKHLCHNGTITESERDRILKALEQESVLDMIIAEIEQVVNQEKLHDEKWALGLKYALHIIDKYKAESEDE